MFDDNYNKYDNDSNDEIDAQINDVDDYKGYFLENNIDDDEEGKFFEYGAHFPYLFLYQKLEILAQIRKEEEENIKEKKNIKKEKNENRIDDESDIFSFFNKNNNRKSRNRNNNYDNFTNQPFVNNNIYNNNNNNEIEDPKIRTYVEKNKKKSEEGFSNEKNKKIESNIKKKNNNISALISNNNKYKEKDLLDKNIMAKMNLYTSFAKKLKMNRNFNFSKKGKNNDEEGSKNKSNSNKKVKSIQLSKEKLKKIIHSSTQSKNHLEKKIKTVNNTFKKSFSKSKENSSSHHNNNNNSNKTTKKNIQSQIIANSLNNILSCYKNKRNFKLSPKQNYPNFKKKRYKNPNVSKNTLIRNIPEANGEVLNIAAEKMKNSEEILVLKFDIQANGIHFSDTKNKMVFHTTAARIFSVENTGWFNE